MLTTGKASSVQDHSGSNAMDTTVSPVEVNIQHFVRGPHFESQRRDLLSAFKNSQGWTTDWPFTFIL